MSTRTPADHAAVNAWIRAQPGTGSFRLTVIQDGRSGAITTTSDRGETFTGPDGLNAAIYREHLGTPPREDVPNDREGSP